VVAKAVDPEVGDEVGRRDLVERGLAHLLAADEEPAVDVPVLRGLQARRQEHGRPVDTVEAADVLPDEVRARPPAGELVLVARLSVPGGRDVVRQRVEPDVGHVRRIPRDRHAPAERGAAHGEVEEAALDEAEGLVAPARRMDHVGMVGVPRQQAVLEPAQAEEVVLLLHLDDLAAAAAVLLHVAGGDVLLVRDRVPASIGAELDVAGLVAGLEERADRLVVTGLGGADELVVGDVEEPPRVLEPLHGAVGPLEGGDAVGLGGLLDLEAVLVRAGQIEDVVSSEAPPTRRRVADQRRVGVADVRRVVHVEDRGGQVEAGHDDAGYGLRGSHRP